MDSIFVMDGRAWHQTGPNMTRDERRIGMFAYYVRPFILPQVVWQDLVSADLRNELTPWLREVLGFKERADAQTANLPREDSAVGLVATQNWRLDRAATGPPSLLQY